MNERQKKTTNDYRDNWDNIFKKPCCVDGKDVDCEQGRKCPRRENENCTGHRDGQQSK